MRRDVLLAVFLTAAGASPCLAAAKLELTDGRLVEGRSVKLQGDEYVLEIDDAHTLTFPAELVKELRLVDDEVPAPTAFRPPAPEVKTSPLRAIRPLVAEEQTKKIGAPSTFRPDPVKPTDTGTNYWKMDPSQHYWARAKWSPSPISPYWTPVSAFDARKDVLAPSYSKWMTTRFDGTWWPTDAYTNLSQAPVDLEVAAAPEPAQPTAGTQTPYPASKTPQDEIRRAKEYLEASRAAAGSLDKLPLLRADREAREVTIRRGYEAALNANREAHGPAKLVLLDSRETLERISKTAPDHCPLGSFRRRSEIDRAAKSFEEPEVARRPAAEEVSFETWSAAGGEIVRWTVRTTEYGKQSIRTSPIARHVGLHDEPAETPQAPSGYTP